MTLNTGQLYKPGKGDKHHKSACLGRTEHVSKVDQPLQSTTSCRGTGWLGTSASKQLLLGILFGAAFLILDGSSTASLSWEGAPPSYLPVGLTLALLLCGGRRYVPAVFISSLVAAVVNYHRSIFSWCGLPGSIAIYLGYVGAAAILRGRWRIDLKLGTLRDVGRYILISLGAAIFSSLFGVLTLWGDGRISRADALRTAAIWWATDALAIITFTPFLLVYVAPLVGCWFRSGSESRPSTAWRARPSVTEILELTAQSGFV